MSSGAKLPVRPIILPGAEVSVLGEASPGAMSQFVERVLQGRQAQAGIVEGQFPILEVTFSDGRRTERRAALHDLQSRAQKNEIKEIKEDGFFDILGRDWAIQWYLRRAGEEGDVLLPGRPGSGRNQFVVDTDRVGAGLHTITAKVTRSIADESEVFELESVGAVDLTINHRPMGPGDVHPTTMRRPDRFPVEELAFWEIIRDSSEALSFKNYDRFLSLVLCEEGKAERHDGRFDRASEAFVSWKGVRRLPYTDANAYLVLKAATEAFIMVHCAVRLTGVEIQKVLGNSREVVRRVGGNQRLDLSGLFKQYLRRVNGAEDPVIPYFELIRRKLKDEPFAAPWFDVEAPGVVAAQMDSCYGIVRDKLTHPCFLELIWSYWNEEGMLVQAINAVSRRFQNMRGNDPDPLAGLEIDPLRRLNNLLWGYIQEEQKNHLLTISRRNYEYDHHYGMRLVGKAVRDFRPADSRSKFIEGFHHLLHLCREFYCQEDDTTVIADGFPILNALQEVHTILTEGQHNQYGDLPSLARAEMLEQQWILARPEFREFLPTRVMVALPEPWMDRVDAMKHIQGWTNVSSLHFRNLAIFGERLLLSIRFGTWNDITDAEVAANWARFWRQEVQGYLHGYRAATGVDLTASPLDTSMPSHRLQDRLLAQVHRR